MLCKEAKIFNADGEIEESMKIKVDHYTPAMSKYFSVVLSRNALAIFLAPMVDM
jgi:hypothetical protein